MRDCPDNELAFLRRICLASQVAEATLLSPDLDLPRLLHLGRRHRVEGLLAAALDGAAEDLLPADSRLALVLACRRVALDYLAARAETLRLSRLFTAAGIPVLVLKGCAVAEQFYAPHPERREAIDIDLLVPPGAVREAEGHLVADGFERLRPHDEMRGAAREMFAYLVHDSVYLHPESGTVVELHHRLLRNPHLLAVPFETLHREARAVSIGDGEILGLGRHALPAYLAAHAASHAFHRLKWLADLARALGPMGASERRDLRAWARRWRVERPVRLALELIEDPGAPSSLAVAAGRAITADEGAAEKGFAELPRLIGRLAYEIRLAPTMRARGFFFLEMLCHPEGCARFPLGPRWWPLHALFGPTYRLGRWAGRARARAA